MWLQRLRRQGDDDDEEGEEEQLVSWWQRGMQLTSSPSALPSPKDDSDAMPPLPAGRGSPASLYKVLDSTRSPPWAGQLTAAAASQILHSVGTLAGQERDFL